MFFLFVFTNYFFGNFIRVYALFDLHNLPTPSEKTIAIKISKPSIRNIKKGHPWLFESSITRESHPGKSGDIAVVFDEKRKFLAVGIYDPHSPIRVRVLHRGNPVKVDRDFFFEKIRTAKEIRDHLPATETDGYRLVYGESDGLPGLVVDRYCDTLVVKIYSACWIPHLKNVVDSLVELMDPERIVFRMNRLTSEHPDLLCGLENGDSLFGPKLEETVVFRENGIFLESDPVNGQKTGFFLDQRDNRERVRRISKGKDVLNVFSYTGGFSLYAAAGQANSVTSVDISKPAIEGSVRNFELNGSDPDISVVDHHYIAGDAFKVMEELAESGKRYGVVVVDPPSFAKKESEVKAAINAYSKLVKLALRLLAPKGTFVMASCSSRVKADQFFSMIFKTASSEGYNLKEIERSEHAVDHPVKFPEGAYLKCLFSRVS